MLRTVLGFVAVFSLCAASLLHADEKKNDTKNAKPAKAAQAKITKVDAKKGTVTVQMKNKEGKEVEKVFKLTEDIRYFDSTGKAAAIDVFESGNDVLIIEAEGHLKQMQKGKLNETKPPEKKPAGTEKKPAEKK